MAQVTITINSREYAVACEDGQEVRIYQLARILDEKAKLLTQGVGQINENMLLAMVGLLLADELSELKKVGNNSSAPAPTPVASGIDPQAILSLDTTLAEQIKTLGNQINSIAKNLESL